MGAGASAGTYVEKKQSKDKPPKAKGKHSSDLEVADVDPDSKVTAEVSPTPAKSASTEALEQELSNLKALLEMKDKCATIINADSEDDVRAHADGMEKASGDGANRPLTLYCNGVYDMCHIGHQALFQRAAQNGNLIVGVHGDRDCMGYKRPPIMSADERSLQVAGCKGVWKVLKNAPLENITQEFMEKYKIDLVVLGEEYLVTDVKIDKWYAYPRESGKYIALPRTDGISTSDLIRRCGDLATSPATTVGGG
eukprot:TRINITY_DN63940_c0_g1_i1.p1 TRINITY_DN63940_c0_g1~~TRINITY_DN63940_c0_g1_i1.p1  ORF type:complete len:253 (+),score=52.87 TRINITY_DN63940_c0_g1_i1:73-831(+)